MTALIAMSDYIADSYNHNNSNTNMLREQLVSALHYLPLGALDILPKRVGRHIGMRRVRIIHPKDFSGKYPTNTLTSVDPRKRLHHSVYSIPEMHYSDPTTAAAKTKAITIKKKKKKRIRGRTMSSSSSNSNTSEAKCQCDSCGKFFHPNGIGPHKAHCPKKGSSIFNGEGGKERLSTTPSQSVSEDKISYVLNEQGKAQCEKCGQFFHLNGIGPHRAHCKVILNPEIKTTTKKRGRGRPRSISSSSRSSLGGKTIPKLAMAYSSSSNQNMTKPKRKKKVKYGYNASGKIQCEMCGKSFHVNGIGPHRAHCTGDTDPAPRRRRRRR